jgi:hypothetical protein
MGADEDNIRRLNLYSTTLSNMTQKFEDEKAMVTDLKMKVDNLYGVSANTTSTVDKQLSILKTQKEEIMKELKEHEAQIVAKETEFVDIKSGVKDAESYGPLFTQQDFLTLMLYVAYIFLSVTFYWRTVMTEGFNKKTLVIFIIAWLMITVMLFSLFNRVV